MAMNLNYSPAKRILILFQKQLILVAFFVIVNFSGFAQTAYSTEKPFEDRIVHLKYNPNKISGLGIFKINSSLESIKRQLLADSMCYFDTTRIVESKRDLANLGLGSFLKDLSKNIHKYIAIKVSHPKKASDGTREIYIGAWNPSLTILAVEKYRVNDIRIDRIFLVFYENKLIHLLAENSTDLTDALIIKYGNYQDQEVFERVGKYPSLQWSNEDIKAVITKPSVIIEVTGAGNFISDLDKKGYEKALSKQTELDKQKLKDL